MKFRGVLIVVAVFCAVVPVAGRVGAADTQPATASHPAAALQAIRYQRSGGFAGTNDVIEITPGGEVVVQGKLLGNGKGQLKPGQVAKLAAVFADWKVVKEAYPAPAGSADMFQFKIRYGTKEVTASEGNQDLPAAFKDARAMLEQIARDVTGK